MASVVFWNSGIAGEEALPASDPGTDRNPAAPVRVINRTFSTHPWDTVYLGDGLQLPGICKIMDGATEIGIDNKKPEGKDGATITVKGYRPGPFEISCTVWTSAQWDELTKVLDSIWRRPEKKVKGRTSVADVAIPIFHPALALYGIHSCAVTGVTFPSDGTFDGAKTIKIKCLENVPPGTKPQTRTAALPSVVKPYQSGISDPAAPVNAGPVKPSANRSNLGPKGPVSTPANGPT